MTDLAVTEAVRVRPSKGSRILRHVFRNHLVLLGLGLTVFMIVIAISAPWLATHDPLETNPRNRLQPPSLEHLMGTDNFGRDLFSRVMFGASVSMRVGFSVVFLSTVVGMVLGLVAGYYRAWDGVLMRFTDGLMAFPGILLAIAILAALGPNEMNVIFALSVSYAPKVARVVRGQVLSIRELEYVQAAVASGASHWRIVLQHIVPNAMSPTIVQATFILALAILAEAGLSYIGAGTPPPAPSWGNVLSEGGQFMYQAPWLTVFPGIFIMIAVLGINLLGDGLRDILDPRV